MGKNPSSHKRLIFLFASFILVVFAALTVVLTLKSSKKSTTANPAPTVNPAAEVENPFSEQTTYDNPFSSNENDKEYQNPFEPLR